jgi:bifunctional non-homologous end joining protein LigD
VTASSPDVVREIEGKRVRLTSLERVLWPAAGFTKGQMLEYYTAIAPVMVPHIADRPMVLSRHPAGVEGRSWFQTQCPARPDWVRTCPIAKVSDPADEFDYCVIDDAPSLLWAANLSTIEFHPLQARTTSLANPTPVVFYLDPGPRVEDVGCWRVALGLRNYLSGMGLTSYPKATGSTGVHVYVPLNGSVSFAAAKSFARRVAADMTAALPQLVIDRPARADRLDKVFIDWAQNNPLRSVIAPYSLRALPWPAVAAPVTWEELEDAVDGGKGHALTFLPDGALERVRSHGDVLGAVLRDVQSLPPT